MDTLDENEFEKTKGVHINAKVHSFCGFGLPGQKSAHETVRSPLNTLKIAIYEICGRTLWSWNSRRTRPFELNIHQ